MSTRPATRRSAAVAAALAVLAPISACGAGHNAETSRQRPTIDGVGAAKGTLTLRNMYVGTAAEGEDAPVYMAIFNGGLEPARLTGITSPVASGGQVPDDAEIPSGEALFFYTEGETPVLQDVEDDLLPAEIIEVTLTFEREGPLVVALPVQGLFQPLSRDAPGVDEPGDVDATSPGATPSPTGTASPSPGSPSPSPRQSPSPTPTEAPAAEDEANAP